MLMRYLIGVILIGLAVLFMIALILLFGFIVRESSRLKHERQLFYRQVQERESLYTNADDLHEDS